MRGTYKKYLKNHYKEKKLKLIEGNNNFHLKAFSNESLCLHQKLINQSYEIKKKKKLKVVPIKYDELNKVKE